MSINVAAKIFDVLCPGSPFHQGYTASIVNLEIVKIVKYCFCMKQAHQSLRRLASTGIFRAQLQIFWPTVANIKKRDYCFGFWFHRFPTNINSIIVFYIFCRIEFFHYFLLTIFCLTVPEKFVRQPFWVSEKCGIENVVNELGGLSRCTVVLIKKFS